MAAAGGDTVVPTNWTGLILTGVAIALVAAATYFGFGMVLGDANGSKEESHHETSLQELYSSNARRGIEAMETVRALPRTALAPAESLDPPAPAGNEDTQAAAELAAQEEEAAQEEADLAAAAAAVQEDAARLADAAAAKAAQIAAKAEEQARKVAKQAAEKASDVKDSASKMISDAGEALDTRYRATTTALRAWWNDLKDSDLGIRFIGPLDSSVAEHGLAVLFDHPVNAATASSFISLTNSAGSKVNANWKNGQNANLIYTAGLQPGRYKLQMESGLPSSNGHTLGETISGDAFVN